jgi:hypothetical protein
LALIQLQHRLIAVKPQRRNILFTEMLGNLPAHLAKVAYTEVGFKLCPSIFDVKVGLKNVKLLAFATEKCWFGASWEKTIYSNGPDEFIGELVVDRKVCLVYLISCKPNFATWRCSCLLLIWITYLCLFERQ